jgi:dolichol-phosphate mannosyltransferase
LYLALGILGEYVGRTYVALQARPAYFVAHDSLDVAARSEAGDAASDPTGGPSEDQTRI